MTDATEPQHRHTAGDPTPNRSAETTDTLDSPARARNHEPSRQGRARAPRLSRPLRRLVLTGHVASSVGWFGLSVGYLTLAIAGLLSNDPATQHGIYQALGVLVPYAVVPISLTALASGLVVAFGSGWGVVRHWWVLTKLVITVVTTTLTAFALRSSATTAAATARDASPDTLLEPTDAMVNLLAAGAVSFALYLFMIVLSIYKPWGRVRRDRAPHTNG